MKVQFKLLDGFLPKKQTIGSSGYDLYSAIDIIVPFMDSVLVRLGFNISIEFGYEAQIRPRSGLALKNKIIVFGSPGTVDSDYRGEVGVLLMNLNKEDYIVKKGDRIAQMIFAKVFYPEVELTDNLDDTIRSSGGWGSTGIL